MKKYLAILVCAILGMASYAFGFGGGPGVESAPYSGPSFGTLTNGKYCIYTTGTGVVCNSEGGAAFAGTESTTGSAGSVKSNATTGVMQVVGPAAGSTRVVTIPDADVTIPALPVSGPASPTAGMVPKWGPSGQALVDAGTLTEDNTTSGNLVKRSTDTFENATSADIPAPKTTVGSGASTRTTAEGAEYVFCTGACTVTPKVPAAGVQLCVWNAPGSATAITLANITDVYYGKTDNSGWQANANYKLVSGGAATDKICIVGYDATHYIVGSSTGTWTHTSP